MDPQTQESAVTLERGSAVPTRPHKVLVAVDFGEESTVALERALAFAPEDAEIDVVHVWNLGPYVGGAFVEGELATERAANEAANQMGVLLAPHEADARLRGIVRSGDPARVLIELSKAYDVLVIGRTKKAGLIEALLGSVASKVVGDAECPVVSVSS
jgi:nucleotide-binding universal stress UspA family protein